MSAENTDSALRELIKTVVALQDEVRSLKKLVLEQNDLITRMGANTTKLVSTAIEGKQVPITAVSSQPRPVRDAGARAKSVLLAINPPKKARKLISPLSLATGAGGGLATSRVDALATTSTSRTDTTPRVPTTPGTSQQDDSVVITANEAERHDNASGWSEVRRRRSRGPISNATCGTAAPGATALQAADRKSYLHLYYVKIGTTSEQVSEHLATICPGDNFTVEALKSRGDYASFKLTVPAKNADKYLSPACWPTDVYIKPWRSGFRNPLQQEGENKI